MRYNELQRKQINIDHQVVVMEEDDEDDHV
jgi:hypothetical protein